jgi:hypothetical protein
VSNGLFKIHQWKQEFCCWANSCCGCRILEVPIEMFLVQPVLESLEGSGKAQGTVNDEWGFHLLGYSGCGEES